MYFNEWDLQYLTNRIRNIYDKPIAVVSLNWHILALTHAEASAYMKDILDACAASHDYKKTASAFGIQIEPCFLEHTMIGYFVVLDQAGDSILSYMKAMIGLLLSPESQDQQRQLSNSRSMLVNQLSNAEQQSLEIQSFMKELGYSSSCPRCGILLEISRQEESTDPFKFDQPDPWMEQLIESHSSYSSEDIYGFLSSGQYLIFKDVRSFSPEDRLQELKNYTAFLLKSAAQQQTIFLISGIGSIYQELSSMRQTYLEALFLITNFDYLNEEDEPCLLIHDYTFEYLASLIPASYWHNHFSRLINLTESSPALLKTAVQLSRNNQNISKTAQKLGLHRNTMIQRFSKLKSLSGLNPMQNDQDRMTFRVFALNVTQKITLHAGIVIQPNSVLHQGMKKMAELVNKRSNGALTINIHTLSLSGDNDQLFEILRSGSIDMVVATTGVMNRFTSSRTKLLEFPFLFESASEAKHLLNTLILKDVMAPLESIGVLCLTIWSMGWRYLTSKVPIRRPQDMAGKRIRIMFTESLDEYYRNMGAIPIKMNYGDVKSALDSGMIDCQENPYSNILGMKFYEEQSYITRLKYYLSTEALYLSKKSLDKLSPDCQRILENAAKETTDWIFTEQQTVINQQCKTILTAEMGMTLVEPTLREEQEWRSLSQSLYDAFPHRDLLKELEKARKDYYAAIRDHQTFSGV